MLSSCSESETSPTKSTEAYFWGLEITQTQQSSENPPLFQETEATIEKFRKTYNGQGDCQSDADALEQSKYKDALNALDDMTAKINERFRIYDAWENQFSFVTKYGVYKGLRGVTVGTPIIEEKNITFAANPEIKLWYLYTSTVTVPLTEELKKKDPATYSVVVPLTECGIDGFEKITSFRYNNVKVYSSSTKMLNEESSFISGGEISLKDKTLTLVFTGTSADLAKMKGEWSANVYATMTTGGILEKDMEALIKVPFTIN